MDKLCDCINEIDTSFSIKQQLFEYNKCNKGIIEKYYYLLKGNNDLIQYMDSIYDNCSEAMTYFNRKMILYSLDTSYLNAALPQNVDCHSQINNEYKQVNADYIITYNNIYTCEYLLDTDYYIKSKIKWTTPCSYYST